jgi:hypothetical protein
MAAFSDTLELALLNHILYPGGAAFTRPTSATTDGAAGTEVSGGSYARQVVTFAVPAAGATSNSAAVNFPTATADWGTITHMALFNQDGSVYLFHGPLAVPKTVNNGDTFSFAIGTLIVGLD